MRMFWEVATPFGLTSLKLLTIVSGLGLSSVAVLLWRIHRRAEKPALLGKLFDLGLYVSGIIFPVFAVLLHVNRSNLFYASFAELAEQLAYLP